MFLQEMGVHVRAHEEGNSRNIRNSQVSGQKPLHIAPIINQSCYFCISKHIYIYIYTHLLTTVLSVTNLQRLHVNHVWGRDVEKDTFVPSNVRVAAGMFMEKTHENQRTNFWFSLACKQFFLVHLSRSCSHGWVPL